MTDRESLYVACSQLHHAEQSLYASALLSDRAPDLAELHEWTARQYLERAAHWLGLTITNPQDNPEVRGRYTAGSDFSPDCRSRAPGNHDNDPHGAMGR